LDEKAEPRRILMIDDEEAFLEIAASRFRKRGHLVLTALNCETGINLIKTVAVDVVFLDLRMPHVDGVETLRRIRQIKKELPVIIVTAHSSDKVIQQAKELGISGVFDKSGDLHGLHAVMEAAL
jgi:CheY-like chemotaxis protein